MKAAQEVASNLRPEDRREVEEGHGVDSTEAVLAAAYSPSCVYFKLPNGRVAAIGGIETGGMIWMLCTDAIYDYPILFTRVCKRYLESKKEKLLWNMVDKRNTVHIKLLKFLGFKFIRELKHGPNNLSFIEFCRVLR